MENRWLLDVKLGTTDELLLLRELLFEGVGPSGNVLLEGSIVVRQGGVTVLTVGEASFLENGWILLFSSLECLQDLHQRRTWTWKGKLGFLAISQS